MNVCIVIAAKHDLQADAVIDQLKGQTTAIRIDPFDDIPPLAFHSDGRFFNIGGLDISLSQVTGVFCRVALEYLNFNEESDPVRRFAAREHLAALVGILLNIPSQKWINYPWNEAQADGKIFPLLAARDIGISIPKFAVSSNLGDLRSFFSESGSAIIKPLTDSSIARQSGAFVEIPDLAPFEAPYTADFKLERLTDDILYDDTPTLVQRKINGKGDVRAVVMDHSVFASYLLNTESQIDSRLTRVRNETPFQIPDALAHKLSSLVVDRLKLRFAAIDLVHGVDDLFYLLDVNPSGNWLWQETTLGLPISKAISQALQS